MIWNSILLASSVLIFTLGAVNNVDVQVLTGTFLFFTAVWGLWANKKQNQEEEKSVRKNTDDPPG